MHHAKALITSNLVHKPWICYKCHMPQNIYSIAECNSHREFMERITGFSGSHGLHTPNH